MSALLSRLLSHKGEIRQGGGVVRRGPQVSPCRAIERTHVTLRKVPGALALGLLASLAAHATLFGGEHAMGGGYHALLMQSALCGALSLHALFRRLGVDRSRSHVRRQRLGGPAARTASRRWLDPAGHCAVVRPGGGGRTASCRCAAHHGRSRPGGGRVAHPSAGAGDRRRHCRRDHRGAAFLFRRASAILEAARARATRSPQSTLVAAPVRPSSSDRDRSTARVSARSSHALLRSEESMSRVIAALISVLFALSFTAGICGDDRPGSRQNHHRRQTSSRRHRRARRRRLALQDDGKRQRGIRFRASAVWFVPADRAGKRRPRGSGARQRRQRPSLDDRRAAFDAAQRDRPDDRYRSRRNGKRTRLPSISSRARRSKARR